MSEKEKIAIVSVRYGKNVVGGGEVLVRQYSNILKEKYDIEIITTKSTKSETWENDLTVDDEYIEGILVRRFKVDIQKSFGPESEFTQIFEQLKDNPENRDLADKFIKVEGPYSESLLNFLKLNHQNYKYIIYWPYQFATTTLGIQITPKYKNILIPTAHDEPNLYFSYVKNTFNNCVKIIYNTEEELELVNKVHKFNAEEKIVSMYINNAEVSKDFTIKFNIDFDYFLYIGRIEDGKGVHDLMQMFINYSEKNKDSNLKLILIGRPVIPILKHKSILYLGYLTEEEKIAAIHKSIGLIQSSKWESLSIVVLETMLAGKPIIVNGHSEVLKGHCKKSNGGLWYTTETEFNLILDYLLNNVKNAKKLGDNGKLYVQENYNKETIKNRLLDFI